MYDFEGQVRHDNVSAMLRQFFSVVRVDTCVHSFVILSFHGSHAFIDAQLKVPVV